MSLSNYARSRSRRNGGIRLIGLVEQSDVAEVTYASAEKGYSAIRLDEDCYFSKYEFREDEAEYRETVSVVNGAQVVTHELIFTLDKMGTTAPRRSPRSPTPHATADRPADDSERGFVLGGLTPSSSKKNGH